MSRSPAEHYAEAERLLEAARVTIKAADERRAERLTNAPSEIAAKTARDEWWDAHIAASDLMGLANVHARLAGVPIDDTKEPSS